MFFQYFVLITSGFQLSQISGIEILPVHSGKRAFLTGATLSLTCRHPALSADISELIFTSESVNISSYLQERTYVSGNIELSIQKNVTVDDTGTIMCKFKQSDQQSVAIEVFEDTKLYDQKRFMDSSTDIIDGETLKLVCPILDSLIPEVTWKRDQDDLNNDRVSLSDVGHTAVNGELTLKDVQLEDRGYYTCTATWYSGEVSFKHRVRVKSHLAPLWPAIGIIAEIIVLVIIILACKDRKKKDDTEPLTSPSTSGSRQAGNRRKYVTTST